MSRAASAPSSSKTTLFHLALLIPWVAIVINAFEEIIDSSYLWHIRAGSVQVSNAEVLTADPFSFTMGGEEWRTQSWLVELGYGWLEDQFGLGFTGLMVLGISVVTFTGILLLAFRWSSSVRTTAIVGLLSAVILPRYLAPRPVLFSFALFVVVLLAWDEKRLRWVIPFVFWLWASIHGSFVIGLGYLVLRLIQKKDWREGAVVVSVSGVVTLLTAHGVGVVSMLWAFAVQSEYLSLISEWRPPDFLEPDLIPFVAALLIITFGATKGRVVANDLWILAPFVVLAFAASRSVGIAWMALIPLLANALGPGVQGRTSGFSRPVATVGGLAILLLPFALSEDSSLDSDFFPVAASEHLEDVNTFHDDATGGYLIWLTSPHAGVFIDDRVEMYGARLQEMVAVRSGVEDWRPVFTRDRIEQALLDVDEPLRKSLLDAGWVERYADESFVLLVASTS